jgi:hypothetical protein
LLLFSVEASGMPYLIDLDPRSGAEFLNKTDANKATEKKQQRHDRYMVEADSVGPFLVIPVLFA